MQVTSSTEVTGLRSARTLHRKAPSLTTSQLTLNKNAPGEQPNRTSDPLEHTLIKLMDGISDISQCGGHENAARDANDFGTPSIRSPTSVDAYNKEQSPFKLAAPSIQKANGAAQSTKSFFASGK